jgi:glutathione S-transferase
MSDLIFHHYPASPFSEKIRLILGYKNLKWKSVMIPAIMPKPDVMALTGGYRRTPILQIGADIYCDSALIADVLEKIAPNPSLYLAPIAGVARTIAHWADNTLFWAAMGYAFQPVAMADILGDVSPETMKAFSTDRAVMRGAVPRMKLPDAKGQLSEYLRRVDDMLSAGKPWLLGEQASIADFSVYHSLWFLRRAPMLAGILQAYPRLLEWMDRVAEIGHGQFEKIRSVQAIELAAAATLQEYEDIDFVDTHDIGLGERVAIMPNDYALDPVVGELVICSNNELALRRTDERAGSIVVHFPRVGFQMKRAD